MKLKSALTVTTAIILLILGAGAASAYIGYRMGTIALKGVSQPEDNPTRKLTKRQTTYRKPQPFKPLDEKTILVKVYNQIYYHNKKAKQGENSKNANSNQSSDPKKTDKSPETSKLPLKTTDQDITLEVFEVKQEAGDLLISVSLTNQGKEAVQFLYSFLEVEDNEGEALGAIVEDLPETIPATGKKVEGVVRIPINLLDEDQTLSFNLTDYPQQTHKLILKDIPVTPQETSVESQEENP